MCVQIFILEHNFDSFRTRDPSPGGMESVDLWIERHQYPSVLCNIYIAAKQIRINYCCIQFTVWICLQVICLLAINTKFHIFVDSSLKFWQQGSLIR